jgi:hypothetical protein
MMSERDPRKAASDSRDFLQAATSAGWVDANARLTEEQVAHLLKCFETPLPEAAARRFSTYAAMIYSRAQAVHQASARFSAAAEKDCTRPRRNVSTLVRDEVKRVRTQIDAFSKRLAKVSENTIHAVDRGLGPAERVMFSDLELALSTVRVSVRRGRQDDATRMTIEALARLYRDVAGRNPKRSSTVDGEAGEFLGLVRAFMRMVRAALPAAARSHVSLSLSKVVREVLAEQRS